MSTRQVPVHLYGLCDRFNASHRIGDAIRVWPGFVGDGRSIIVTIVAPGARVLCGTAVVQVTGGHGCIPLSNVDWVPDETPP
jgi:hypothetical protein